MCVCVCVRACSLCVCVVCVCMQPVWVCPYAIFKLIKVFKLCGFSGTRRSQAKERKKESCCSLTAPLCCDVPKCVCVCVCLCVCVCVCVCLYVQSEVRLCCHPVHRVKGGEQEVKEEENFWVGKKLLKETSLYIQASNKCAREKELEHVQGEKRW